MANVLLTKSDTQTALARLRCARAGHPHARLELLGITIGDPGVTCSGSGFPCSYDNHRAHLTFGKNEADLSPGAQAFLGDLNVALAAYESPGFNGQCDDSARTTLVGVVTISDAR